jgi:acyl dehydratase
MAEQQLSSSPDMRTLYAKAAAGVTVNPVLGMVPVVGGRFSRKKGLPDTELVLADVEVDREHLNEYNRVCGFELGETLPPTYPHMLAFPLSMQLMAASDFPFPVIGLVHIRNRIEQARAIGADEPLTLRVSTVNLGDHPKGRSFEVHTEAEVDGAPVWRSVSTYLRKGGGSGDGGSSSGGKKKDKAKDPADEQEPKAIWEVPDDIGRRYAAVSGDSNPIHLRRSTAMLFGMPRPIAHGMWTKARCLAALEGKLPDKMAVDVTFKLPVFLPSKVAFTTWQEKGGARSFALESAKDGKPHLSGTAGPQ